MADESYTLWEQETIINFNRAEDMASVYTHEPRWQNHIENVLGIKPISKHGQAREYVIPKKWLRLPRKPSEARRAVGLLRAQKQPVGVAQKSANPSKTAYTVAKSTKNSTNPTKDTRGGKGKGINNGEQ